MNKTFVGSSLVILLLILLFQILHIIDLQKENREITLELLKLKSEDNSFRDSNLMDTPEDEKVEKIEAKPEEVAPVVNNKFFILNPMIDLEKLAKKYIQIKKVDVKQISVKEKKRIFINSVLPAIKQSRHKLLTTYKSIKSLKNMKLTIQDEEYLKILYKTYKIKEGNIDALLLAVKPHPTSVILAQAALESGWGTSRFYKEANNIFGIWSFNEDDERIKARSDREVYLKRYDSFVEAVDDYMLMLGRNPRYQDFRNTRYKTDNPYTIIKHLEIYSELRGEYVKRLRAVIRANKFARYDIEKDEEVTDIAE